MRTSPESFPAERVLPAPRAGERPLFAYLQWENPLRPGTMNILHETQNSAVLHVGFSGITCLTQRLLRFRPVRVPRNRFPLYNLRAVLEIKYIRFPLHKHSVSTSPFPLPMAFSQNFTVPRKKRRFPPRPSYPVGAGRYPLTGRTSFSRPRERRNDDSSRNSTRAPVVKLSFPTRAGAVQSFFEKQSARVARNKRHSLSATQTFRFNFPTSAHSGVFAKLHCSARRAQFPAPASKAGAGREYSRRETASPSGRTFRSFSLAKTVSTSSGKVSPARGAQNKQILLIKNHK